MGRRGLLIIMTSISPEKEEAFNRWYNEDHLPKVLERMPGVLSGRRYKIVEGGSSISFWRYMSSRATKHWKLLKGQSRPSNLFSNTMRLSGREAVIVYEPSSSNP